MDNPIIVALDLANASEALALAMKLKGRVGMFKIGSELFTRGGPDLVKQMRSLGLPVFLDLKFHDIPNTVARAVESAVQLDVQMLTIHSSGGRAMMRAAEEVAQSLARPPMILGVTVLTSMDEKAGSEVGMSDRIEAQVERLARLAIESGLRGLVCSPLEIKVLRAILPKSVVLVTPGIRAQTESGKDDQKRTMSAAEAMAAGANWLVVGRPIYASNDPVTSAENILATLSAN